MAAFDTRSLDELAAALARALPASMKSLRGELESNFRALLRAHLDKLELVSRERFDTQAALLARTQARLVELERRLAALEREGKREPRRRDRSAGSGTD